MPPAIWTSSSGYGLGLRWKIPAGPLSLDAAHGEETGGVRLHFAVSLSF